MAKMKVTSPSEFCKVSQKSETGLFQEYGNKLLRHLQNFLHFPKICLGLNYGLNYRLNYTYACKKFIST